jgi:hypothetical protein
MQQTTIAALLGVVTGFILPSVGKFIHSRIRGTRFENAVWAEIDEANDAIHSKLLWLSRDCTPYSDQIDPRLLVEVNDKLLYLGEDEDFQVSHPFWENNLLEIIEATSTAAFRGMCREITQAHKFVAKFRDMKLAFKIGGGDAKQMARACYRDLRSIHYGLFDHPRKVLDSESQKREDARIMT